MAYTADEYLGQVRLIDHKIANYKYQIDNLRLMAIGTTCPTDADRVKSSGSQDPMGNLVAKIADLSAEVENLFNWKMSIAKKLEKLPFKQYNVLYQRYFMFKTLKEIADDMDMSESNIKKIKKRGLEQFTVQFIDKKR